MYLSQQKAGESSQAEFYINRDLLLDYFVTNSPQYIVLGINQHRMYYYVMILGHRSIELYRMR